ncbi:MAG: hypothetical protein K2L60_04190, partial [Bacteroides sp.]|nr:hypothetical protein [Bacteroides sp.]
PAPAGGDAEDEIFQRWADMQNSFEVKKESKIFVCYPPYQMTTHHSTIQISTDFTSPISLLNT